MKKEKFKWLVDSGKGILSTFILAIVIFKIVYYNESILNIIKFSLALFWIYLLPGFFVLSMWRGKFNYLERVIGGFAVGAATVPLISYLLALISPQLRLITYALPLIVLIFCSYIIHNSGNKQENVNV